MFLQPLLKQQKHKATIACFEFLKIKFGQYEIIVTFTIVNPFLLTLNSNKMATKKKAAKKKAAPKKKAAKKKK